MSVFAEETALWPVGCSDVLTVCSGATGQATVTGPGEPSIEAMS